SIRFAEIETCVIDLQLGGNDCVGESAPFGAEIEDALARAQPGCSDRLAKPKQSLGVAVGFFGCTQLVEIPQPRFGRQCFRSFPARRTAALAPLASVSI